MIRVGVTGGIGSGKSTVCDMFAELGAPVYCSDRRARELACGEAGIRHKIVDLLGDGAYRDGLLDSAYVASKVFSDKMLLASLDAIVHPAVALDFEAWAVAFVRYPYVLLESAILLESGFDRLVDRVITVSAAPDVRFERLSARGISRPEAARRMANQLTDARREACAWATIDNNGSLSELAARVELIDKELRK